MTGQPRILVFAGALRKDSYNKKLARLAAKDAKDAGAKVTFIDLADYPLPVYNGDIEEKEGLPQNAIKLKELFMEHDGLIIASPEYNSSVSAALKNAIDWISRPASSDEPFLVHFIGKTALLLSASVGALGGLRGLVHLRAILENIFVHVTPDQKCIPSAMEAFDAEGNLKNGEVRKAIKGIVENLYNLPARFTVMPYLPLYDWVGMFHFSFNFLV